MDNDNRSVYERLDSIEATQSTTQAQNEEIIRLLSDLKNKQVTLLEKGLQTIAVAENTVFPDDLQNMIDKHEKSENQKEQLV